GCVLVLAQCDQISTEAAVLDDADQNERGADEGENNPVERRAALELKRLRAQVELDQDADTGAGDRCDARQDAQYFGEGKRYKRKVGSLQPGTEGKRADNGTNRRARRDAEQKPEPSVDAVLDLE